MSKLKVDKKGAIKREDGSVLGTPIKTGKIYRGASRTGRIDLETSVVYNLKEEPLGEVDLSVWGDLFSKALLKLNKTSRKDKKIPSEGEDVKVENTPGKRTNKSNSVYVPGKDSTLIVRGWLGRILWPSNYSDIIDEKLDKINKENGWEYTNWEWLCAKEDLSEEVLSRYVDSINWYVFLRFHPEKQFSETFKAKYSKQLSLSCIK